MGSFSSRQNAGVEEVDISSTHAYKFPPRSGNYFGSHFIMGGERFDTPQPEAYLFGENADLNFLGSKPTPFPYPPPQANEPTKTLKSLVNIRKESLRFVRVTSNPLFKGSPTENKSPEAKTETDDADKGVNVEFTFDSECKCAITIYYLCQEEVAATGVTYLSSNPNLVSETYHYKKGSGQVFCQPSHICYPGTFAEDQLSYNIDKEVIPVAIHCVAEEPVDEPHQSHTTIAVIDRHCDGSYGLRALKQKLFVDGLSYLLQEIYGIENKNSENKGSMDTETEDNGSECVICMCDGRDTLILPCRHLCLCNSCADSLRYQANNCPICRAPFRALLQIRALQKSTSAPLPSTAAADPGTFGAIPAGYEPVSLLEALNGPSTNPRPAAISPLVVSLTPDTEGASAAQAAEALNRSTLEKSSSKPGDLRDKGGSPSSEDLNLTPEFRMSVLLAREQERSPGQESSGRTSPLLPSSKRPSKRDKDKTKSPRDTVVLVDETLETGEQSDAEADSEAEKLSPLLDVSASTDPIIPATSPRSTEKPLPGSPPHPASLPPPAAADDSDYYTPDDQGPGILDNDKPEPRTGPSMSAGNTPVRAPGTPLSAATSHRSSGDSFSSSSSTRQLLPPIAVVTAGAVVNHQTPESAVSLQDVAMV